MPLSYDKNKQHIYNWRANNTKEYNAVQARIYYKKQLIKKGLPIEWINIRFIFFDILWNKERE